MKKKNTEVPTAVKKQAQRMSERTLERPRSTPEPKKASSGMSRDKAVKARIIAALGKLHPMD